MKTLPTLGEIPTKGPPFWMAVVSWYVIVLFNVLSNVLFYVSLAKGKIYEETSIQVYGSCTGRLI